MNEPEFWLRGPVEGVPDLLQPVAHALLQANREIKESLVDFPRNGLWKKPFDMASVGFHLQHIAGVLDRLFTYADGNPLSNTQLKYLSEEGLENDDLTIKYLTDKLEASIFLTIDKLKQKDPATFGEFRGVGRNKLPSTVWGLIFHAAEHTMRHTGQLIVTAKIINHE